MAGQTTVNQIQLGDNATATQNFVLQTNSDGTATLARGNVGATTQDVLTVNGSGQVALTQGLSAMPANATPASMVVVGTANGYGSTNTVIARYTTIITNQGSDITYADSATAGASFTINTSGVYSISALGNCASAATLGISINSNQLTTGIVTITQSNRVAFDSIPAGGTGNCGATIYIAAGGVIRSHADSAYTGTAINQFTITRVS